MITIKEQEQEKEIDWLNLPYGTLFEDNDGEIYIVVKPNALRYIDSEVIYAISITNESYYLDTEFYKNWKLLPNTTLEYKKP